MEFLQSINWVGLILAVLGIIATYFGAPLAKKAQELVDACKYGKYAQMLYDTVDKIVKALYTTTVDELKKNSKSGKLSDVDIAGLKESVSEMVKNSEKRQIKKAFSKILTSFLNIFGQIALLVMCQNLCSIQVLYSAHLLSRGGTGRAKLKNSYSL